MDLTLALDLPWLIAPWAYPDEWKDLLFLIPAFPLIARTRRLRAVPGSPPARLHTPPAFRGATCTSARRMRASLSEVGPVEGRAAGRGGESTICSKFTGSVRAPNLRTPRTKPHGRGVIAPCQEVHRRVCTTPPAVRAVGVRKRLPTPFVRPHATTFTGVFAPPLRLPEDPHPQNRNDKYAPSAGVAS